MNIPDDISDQRGRSDDNSSHAHYDESRNLSSTGLSLDGDDEELDKDVNELIDKKTDGSLGELLQGRTVYLVRHANTGKAPKDEERSLTPVAERQCTAFVSQYGDSMDRVTYCFTSPVKRAVKTASFLGNPDPTPVDCLYFNNYYTPELQKVDDDLGYAPLADYLRYEEGKGETLYGEIRKLLGDGFAKAIGSELEKAKAVGEWEGDILIVTHATTISLLAQAVLLASSPNSEEEMEKILSFNVGECEGFQISSGKVTLLRNDVSGNTDDTKNSDFIEK